MVWLGHSSRYMQLAGKRILIDPVFSDYAAPFSFINKAFPGDYPWRARRDAGDRSLIISSPTTIWITPPFALSLPKIKRVITPLGSDRICATGEWTPLITEADWQQAVTGQRRAHRPRAAARHCRPRGMKRNQTLWASFLFVTRQQKIYYSGDSGMGRTLKHRR